LDESIANLNEGRCKTRGESAALVTAYANGCANHRDARLRVIGEALNPLFAGFG
jgi:hypothetical protein